MDISAKWVKYIIKNNERAKNVTCIALINDNTVFIDINILRKKEGNVLFNNAL